MTSNDPKIVGRHGQYEIFKVSISNPHPSKRLKLGLIVRSKEWMSKDLHASFPNCSEYAYIHEIKARSLAYEAGALTQDILCSYSAGSIQNNNTTEPTNIGFFHDLLIQGSGSGKSTNVSPGDENEPSWKLMTCANFELLVGRAEYEQQFSFYVARKAMKLDGGGKLPQGVTLSSTITERARTYNSLSPRDQQILLDDAKANARLHFEVQRDEILEALPESVKSMFYEIGFVQWGRASSRSYLPVLILSPFDIGPGRAREAWMQKYHLRKEKASLDKMNHLVYWYGEPISHASEGCFSIVTQESFIPWNEAKKKSLQKIPKKASQKKMLALKQVNEASRSSATNRKHILPVVLEFHDLLCEADLAQHDLSGPAPVSTTTIKRESSTTTTRGRSIATNRDSVPATSRGSSTAPRSKRRRISFAASKAKDQEGEGKEEPVEKTRPSPRAGMRSSPRKAPAPLPSVDVKIEEKPIMDPKPRPEPVAMLAPKKASAHISPLLRKRSPPRSRPPIPSVAKITTSNPVSSSSENEDSASLSLDDAEDRKPQAKIPDTVRPSTGSVSVQTVLESFCQHIQELSRRNAVLKSTNQQLQASVKGWKEQYSSLAAAIGEKEVAKCVSPDVEGFRCDISGGASLENMRLCLNKVTKQNAAMERDNARLEAECGEWQAKIKSLVDGLKQS